MYRRVRNGITIGLAGLAFASAFAAGPAASAASTPARAATAATTVAGADTLSAGAAVAGKPGPVAATNRQFTRCRATTIGRFARGWCFGNPFTGTRFRVYTRCESRFGVGSFWVSSRVAYAPPRQLGVARAVCPGFSRATFAFVRPVRGPVF